MATMPKRIVYTRPDGGVSVCAPSHSAMRYMTGGGGRWSGFPRGFLDRQIAEQAKYGVGEWAAARYVRAMQFGGLSTAEAYATTRDRFCGHLGTGHELWDVGDVPRDRWFRDAWVRGHNGGPIDISLSKARGIQFRRITDAVDQENARRRTDINLFDRPIQPDWSVLRDAIRRAHDVGELRQVWPSEPVHRAI
jgi:hypothetical protein